MKYGLFILLAIWGVTAPPDASLRTHAQGESVQVNPELSVWDNCLPRVGLPTTLRLCESYAAHIDLPAYKLMSEILDAGVSDRRALCVMDTAIVRSQYHCAYPQDYGGVAPLAELARLLGLNWEKLGVLDRADELFRYADALMERSDRRHLEGRQAILRDWALLEVARGNADHAKALAKLQTALERRAHEQGKADDWSLISALSFEANILTQLGLPEDAQSALDEAKALKSKQGIAVTVP